MTATIVITLEQQIAAVAREVKLRESAYPRFIEAGRLSHLKADHEIAAMKAVLTTLQSLKENATAGAQTG
jgi:hypothetical protein